MSEGNGLTVYHPRQPQQSPLWRILDKHYASITQALRKHYASFEQELSRSIVRHMATGARLSMMWCEAT